MRSQPHHPQEFDPQQLHRAGTAFLAVVATLSGFAIQAKRAFVLPTRSMFCTHTRRAWMGWLLAFLLLAGPPTMAVAAVTMTWDPLFVDFGIVPIGTTATQHLTLGNAADSTEDLTIHSLEFTFNQGFTFTGSVAVPALAVPAKFVLAPGESLDVELTFTPNDFSFFMADLLITNTSDNAPSLIVSPLGQGAFGAFLSVSPPSGQYATTQNFDLTLILGGAVGVSVVGESAAFDGADVTALLANCIDGELVAGGVVVRCPYLGGQLLNAAGPHTLTVTLDLSNGSSVTDTVTWEGVVNTEPPRPSRSLFR
jgi:hypothetical protein